MKTNCEILDQLIGKLRNKTGKDIRIAYSKSGKLVWLRQYGNSFPFGVTISPSFLVAKLIAYIQEEYNVDSK